MAEHGGEEQKPCESRYTRLSGGRHLRERSPSRLTSLIPHFLLARLQSLHLLLTAADTGVGATQMNSLTYLTRQFDVLASPRAPPSTPTSESPPPLSLAPEHQNVPHTRVRSWSTRALRVPFSGGSPSGMWTLKRSLSSPGEINPTASADNLVHYPSRGPSTSSSSSPKPPSRRPSVPSTENANRPRGGSANVIRSIFFVRIALLLWNAICTALRSLTRQGNVRVSDEVAVEDGTEEEEKDTEDESKDVKSVLLGHSQTPFPPAIPPPLSPIQPPSPAVIPPDLSPPPISRSLSETPQPLDSDLNSLPAPRSTVPFPSLASATQYPPTTSRASTPSAAAHKTPFHLPKTLVLDLDETLIHATSRPMLSASSSGSGLLGISIFGRGNKGAGHVVEVVLGGRSTLYHVYKRPFVDYFLRKVSVTF